MCYLHEGWKSLITCDLLSPREASILNESKLNNAIKHRTALFEKGNGCDNSVKLQELLHVSTAMELGISFGISAKHYVKLRAEHVE